jgi:rhamnopyranosyl-N-acetylglucosaminyl-diphospho-decaprenol beta-1,3/1,4-galactofuranosyltransferase
MIQNKRVAAIMVTYNRRDVVQEALDCLQSQTYPIDYIVVVDNNSSDDTIQVLLERKKKDQRISIVNSTENAGFGAGLALGMNWSLDNLHPDYMWLMDDDSYPVVDALELLIKNSIEYQYDVLGLSGYVMRMGAKKKVLPENNSAEVDFILIDNALIAIETIKNIGVPSGEFFMMCEDYDYCLRIKEAGFKLGVIRNNHVNRLNLGSQKFSKATLWRGYYHSRNHLIILKRHFTFVRLVNYIIVQLKYLVASLQAKDRWTRIKFRLIGVYHGFQSVKGKTLDPVTLTFNKNL